MTLKQTTQQDKKVKNDHKLLKLCGLLTIFIAYTATWFYLGHKIQNNVINTINRLEKHDIFISCTNLHKTGYPLKIGVACDQFNSHFLRHNLLFSSQAFSARAPIYAPHWLEFNIKSPISLHHPRFAPLTGNWSAMQIQTNIGDPLPKRFNFTTHDLVIANQDERFNHKLEAQFLKLHMKKQQSDAHVRLDFDNLILHFPIPHEKTFLPSMDGAVDLIINDAFQFLNQKITGDRNAFLSSLHNQGGTIERANVRFASGGGLVVSGPFSFSDAGYLNGNFEIAIDDQAALLRTARRLFPSQFGQLQAVFFIIGSMPKNKDGQPILSVTVNEGRLQLGFIKLGHINPI